MITFKVFELTKQQEEDDEEDIEIQLEDCDLVEHTFYNIDNIKPLNNGRYCLISSGGFTYPVNERHTVVKEMIAEQKRILFN